MMVALNTACGGDGSPTSTRPSVPAGVPENAQVATVVEAVDADTVRVELGQQGVDVSVIGVVRPATGMCRAAEADAFARQELPAGATVYLMAGSQGAATDGALLRYVWDSDGEFYNDKLLRQGFAKVAPAPQGQRFRDQLTRAEADAWAAGRGVWGCLTTTTRRPTTVARPTTTRAAPVATTSPRPTSATNAPTTSPAGRTVSLGETFSVGVGEAVSVPTEGVTVTFSGLVSDSRCRPGQQCIVAGDATITVTVAKRGAAPATLTLNTDAPKSARSGNDSVELVQLGFDRPAVARLRVT